MSLRDRAGRVEPACPPLMSERRAGGLLFVAQILLENGIRHSYNAYITCQILRRGWTISARIRGVQTPASPS